MNYWRTIKPVPVSVKSLGPYERVVRNLILPGRVYECTQTIYSRVTSKARDIDLHGTQVLKSK